MFRKFIDTIHVFSNDPIQKVSQAKIPWLMIDGRLTHMYVIPDR